MRDLKPYEVPESFEGYTSDEILSVLEDQFERVHCNIGCDDDLIPDIVSALYAQVVRESICGTITVATRTGDGSGDNVEHYQVYVPEGFIPDGKYDLVRRED